MNLQLSTRYHIWFLSCCCEDFHQPFSKFPPGLATYSDFEPSDDSFSDESRIFKCSRGLVN